MDATRFVSVRLVAHADRVGRGWPIGSEFVERFWLPVIGPSSVAVLRWFDRDAARFARLVSIDLADLAAEVGLGRGTGRCSPIVRTLGRLAQFDAARVEGVTVGMPLLAVYTHLFAVPARLVARLPERLQIDHARAVAALEVV